MTEFFNDIIIKNACRTCLGHYDDMVSIYDRIQDTGSESYDTIIMSFTTVKIDLKDGFSDIICQECQRAAVAAHRFKLLCESSDSILRKNLPQPMSSDSCFDIKIENSESSLNDDGADEFKYENSNSIGIDETIKEEIWSFDEEMCLKDSLDIKDTKELKDRLNLKKNRKKKKYSENKKERLLKKKHKKLKTSLETDISDELTSEGYKKIYECIKCHAIFKNKNPIEKHFMRFHTSHLNSKSSFQELCKVLPSDRSENKDSITMFGSNESQSESLNLNIHLANAYDKGNIIKSDNIFESKDGVIDNIKNARKIIDFEEKDKVSIKKKKHPCYKCEDCDFTCDVFITLKNHLTKHRGEKSIICDECNYTCSNLGNLKNHKLIHTGAHKFTCSQCPFRTNTLSKIQQHEAIHSNEKSFVCDQCDFTCNLQTNLTQHIQRRHEQRKNYACNICNKRFFSSSHRTQHMRSHTGERPHVCDQCGNVFSEKSNLAHHVALQHSETPPCFPCPTCSYKGRSLYTLTRHIMRHTGEKPLQCDQCPYSCISINSLKKHKIRHNMEATYACDSCDFRCYTEGRMRQHSRTHLEIRPYPCSQCHYRGKTHSDLRKHKVTHTSEKPYSCSHCPYRANHPSNLRKHLINKCIGLTSAVPVTQAVDIPVNDNSGNCVRVSVVKKTKPLSLDKSK